MPGDNFMWFPEAAKGGLLDREGGPTRGRDNGQVVQEVQGFRTRRNSVLA